MLQQKRTYLFFSWVKIFLYPFALIYGAIVWLRNRLYDSGFFSSVEFSIPVISVGNLSVGGTGKTPHIEYLIRLLQYEYKVATMSRGYKRRTQGFLLAGDNTNALHIGDEPMQYHMKFPEVAVSVAEERMTGIPLLLQSAPEVDIVLLDDAYQHRSVKPGLNILITDFSQPFYEDFILPYGRLREGRTAYRRADIIIVSKCPPDLSKEKADVIENRINPLPHQKVFFSTVAYGAPYDFFTQEKISLRNKNAVLVCCIAKPQPLENFLKQNCADVHMLSYPDHHYFLSRDMEEVSAAYRNWDTPEKLIVTTEKDAARLHLQKEKLIQMSVPVAVLPIRVRMLFDKDEILGHTIISYVEKALADHRTDNADFSIAHD